MLFGIFYQSRQRLPVQFRIKIHPLHQEVLTSYKRPTKIHRSSSTAAIRVLLPNYLLVLRVKNPLEPIHAYLRQIRPRAQLTMLTGPERVIELVKRSQISQIIGDNLRLSRNKHVVLAISDKDRGGDLIVEPIERVVSKLTEPVEGR